jgi:DNA-directed RNA polymerase subunit RPC12/RpoP
MSWELVAENLDSVPSIYNIYECSNCGFRIAAPKKPEITCYECGKPKFMEDSS